MTSQLQAPELARAIGKLPSDWNHAALRYVASSVTQGPNPDYAVGTPDDSYRVLKTKDLYDDIIHYDRADAISRETFSCESKAELLRGDIVLAIVGKGSIGKANLFLPPVDTRYIFSRALGLIRTATKVDRRFLLAFIQSSIGKQALDFGIDGSTGQEVIKTSYLKSIPIPLPPLHTQRAIADFLGRKTRVIGELIRKKERLIELLQEKRQALMTQAVTKGLDPNAPMKDSGVQWIGTIPGHWNLLALRAVLVERGEYNTPLKTKNFLSVVKDVGVIPYEERAASGNKKSDDMEKYKIVYPGDIVANRMNLIFGSVGISRYHGCSSIEYYVLHGRTPNVDTRFYSYLFRSRGFQNALVGIGTGILAHRMRIHYEELKKVLVPVPPPDEQRRIANVLDKQDRVSEGEKLVAEQIQRLREYRLALIAASVTGQIDVTAEVAA